METVGAGQAGAAMRVVGLVAVRKGMAEGLEAAAMAAGGTVEATEGAEVEIYYRPPDASLEPEDLAKNLRRRLRRQAETDRDTADSGTVIDAAS